MTRYIETFFRHKVLLLTPLVLTLLVSVWYVSKQPTTYTATTSVWFDTPLPGPAYLDNANNSPIPSAQAQTLLTQLLSTKDFLVKAGQRGPLAESLAKSGGAGSLEDRIARRLGGEVTATPTGPQILYVGMTDRDPTIATEELKAVVQEYFDYVKTVRNDRQQASLDYYTPRLKAANDALDKARADQIAYLEAHPEAGAVGFTDPTYAALTNAVATAQSEFTDVQKAYTQADQALTDQSAAVASHVIDQPEVAVANSKKKSAIFAGVAALLFGLLLGLLGLVALNAADTAARRREDVETSGGLQVVATISEFPRERERAREASSE